MPKQARALRTYDRVLDAAAQEFALHGYAEANLQRIADRIGLTKGALYGHFATKEDLATALADHLSAAADALLREYDSSAEAPLDKLRGLLLTGAALLQDDDRAHAALRLAVERAYATQTPVPLLGRMRHTARHLVDRIQRDGLWNPAMPTIPLADLLVLAFFGTYWSGAAAERAGLTAQMTAFWDVLSMVLTQESADR